MISKTEKEVKGPNKAEKLFNELDKTLKEFKEKILSTAKGIKNEASSKK